MGDTVQIEFLERNQQWIVTLLDSAGGSISGEPFPASGHERFTKLDQVLTRLRSLGYRATHIPYDKVNEFHYVLDVEPL